MGIENGGPKAPGNVIQFPSAAERQRLSEEKEKKEALPSLESVMIEFKKYYKDGPFKIIKQQLDEKGVVKLEAEGKTNDRGERKDLEFSRTNYDYLAADIPTESRFSASIHVMAYEDEMPVPGECMCIANYRDGEWHPTGDRKPTE